MDPTQALDEIAAVLARYKADQTPPSLPSGSNLTLALEQGGVVQLEPNGTYEGTATFKTSGTTLRGAPGSRVIGSGGPAVYVPPGVHGIKAQAFEATAPGYTEAVVRLGDNGPTQTRLDQEPYAIVLGSILVPTHRGKRAFEINAKLVSLVDCGCRDTWHPSFDSQGICVINSSGGLSVIGGEYQAGSSCFMSGGDTVKMISAAGKPVTPMNGTLDGVKLTRPLGWRTDGVNRRVKNLFEIKNGWGFTFRNGLMSGNWKAAQTGEPIMLTPTRGGISIGTAIERSVIRDVPSCLVLVGQHQDDYTVERSSADFAANRVLLDKSLGGTGTFLKVGAQPSRLRVIGNLVQSVGLPSETLMEFYRGTVRTADGGTAAGGAFDEFSFVSNRTVCGKYAFRLDGEQGGGPNGEGLPLLGNYEVIDNHFGGDAINGYQRANFQSNTYMNRAAFDAAYPWQEV